MKELGGGGVTRRAVTSMRWWVASAVLIGSLIVAPAAWAGRPISPKTGYARILRACSAPTPGHATCFALVRAPVVPGTPASVGARPFVVGGGASSPGPAGGFTPEALATAYGYDPNASGAGQTVAIVDAFDDPEIENDLGKFDSHYGLPSCTTANECFKKVGQTGSTSSLPAADTTGWSVEITLDVETVHAACPKCKILLVEGNSSSFADLATAVNEAVTLGATEVSNSYGGGEIGPKEVERAAYTHPGIPIVASTGDNGYYGWDIVNEGFFGEEMPNTPASLPSVVAVGGTSLKLNPNGTRASETVWNNNGPGDEIGRLSGFAEGATGGGCSKLFGAQPWQYAVSGFAATGCGTARLDADVSAVADPRTGVDIYDSYKCGSPCEFPRVEGGWVTIGGTSLSAPFISSMYALAGGGGGVRYPALTLYGHVADASLRFDVTSGGNGYCGGESTSLCKPELALGLVDCGGTTACNATSGFDGPTGVGTPSGLGLFKPLLPSAAFTPPASPTAGIAAGFNAAASSDPYPGGSIASDSWSWGDGTTNGEGVSPAHTYAAAGIYSVTLTVTDNYGLAGAASTKSIEVSKNTLAEEEAATKHKHEEEEAASKQKQEEAAATKKHEEEAAAAKREETKSLTASTSGQGIGGFQVNASSPVPDAQLASTALVASASGTVVIKITCPRGETSCKGTVTLRTLTAVSARLASAAKRKAILTLATASFTVAGGQVTTVTLHLSAKARTLLARSHVLRVRATIVAHDAAGATHATETIVTLRAAKTKHGRAERRARPRS
jgi:PKD repeat protein